MLSHRKLDVSFDLYLDVYINIFLKQFSTLQQSYGHFSGTLTLFRSTFHLEVGFPSNLPPSPFHHQLVFPRIRTPGIAASFPWHISFIIPRCVAPKEYLCARLSRNYRRNHCGPFWSHLITITSITPRLQFAVCKLKRAEIKKSLENENVDEDERATTWMRIEKKIKKEEDERNAIIEKSKISAFCLILCIFFFLARCIL